MPDAWLSCRGSGEEDRAVVEEQISGQELGCRRGRESQVWSGYGLVPGLVCRAETFHLAHGVGNVRGSVGNRQCVASQGQVGSPRTRLSVVVVAAGCADEHDCVIYRPSQRYFLGRLPEGAVPMVEPASNRSGRLVAGIELVESKPGRNKTRHAHVNALHLRADRRVLEVVRLQLVS